LEIEPDIKLTKSLVTPELQDAFEEAVLAGDKGGGGGAASAGGGEKAGGGESAGGGAANAAGGEENAAAGPGGGEDEDHRKPKPKPRPKKKDDEDKDKGDEEGQTGTVYLGLTIGSSAGLASGSGHMNPAHALGGPGFAVGQLGQIEPQLGFFVNSTT